ncbi:TonB-dependent siderophore receptor [Chitinophaga sp. 30R24]|uniref:TonB-dependent siderophore receptor n=1 Tax=Chitinophaga sp. 30R24 TaxID=3248838 RepID=UPI003B90C3C0
MNKHLLSAAFAGCMALFASQSWAQANASLYGKILTSDGKAVSDASMMLVEAKLEKVTDQAGAYRFDHLKSGNYTIKVSVLGLPPVRRNVSIASGEEKQLDITLSQSSVSLQEVVITSLTPGKLLDKASKYVAKMPLDYLENPQVYSTVSDKLLEEQVTTDLSEGLKNVPGIVKMQGSIGRSGDGAVYYNLRGFPTRISMIDGIPGQTNGEIDVANIESVEVIKGPSGTLYGGALTTFGGLINVVTKKPLDTLGGAVSYTAGSYDLSRLTADVYGPVNKARTLRARVNTAYHTRNSFQDAGFRKSFFIAPAITYDVNDRFTINVGAEFYNYEGTNPSIIFLSRTRQLFARTPDELHFDWSRSYTSNDITLKAPSSNIHGRADYQLGNGWTSSTNFSRNIRKTNGMYQYEFVRGNSSDDLLERNVQLQHSSGASTSVQQNFNGDFRIGGIRNRLLVGLDYLNQTADNDNSPIIKYDTISGSDPGKKYVMLSYAAAVNKITASTAAPVVNHTSSNVYSVYASDVVNITDNLLAMLSLRLDRFESNGTRDFATNKIVANSNYGQTALSPKFGLVYEVLPGKVSVFGNYMNGFSNVAPVTQPLPDISGNFKPQHANQWEGGVKLDLLNNHLSFTASYYDIKVDNITRDGSITVNGTDYAITVQDGTQISKGVEVELVATPLAGLNIVAGYSHNDSKLIRTSKDLEGRRPVSAGPPDISNAWVSYTIPVGKLHGFGVGVGGNYVSDYLTVNAAPTGIFTFPSYTLLNATVFYDVRRFRLGLKFDNITNVQYFSGQGVINPQMPFNCSANATVRF